MSLQFSELDWQKPEKDSKKSQIKKKPDKSNFFNDKCPNCGFNWHSVNYINCFKCEYPKQHLR